MMPSTSLLLAACYWIIDVKGWRRWTTPLVILGVNAITLFVASGMLVKTLGLFRVAGADGRDISVSRWAYLTWFVPMAAPKNASLLYAIANLVILFGLLWWMYRRRIFLRQLHIVFCISGSTPSSVVSGLAVWRSGEYAT